MPNSKRRELRRAIERARARTAEIDEASMARRDRWCEEREVPEWLPEREQNAINDLYAELRGDRRDVYATGLVSEGATFRKPKAEMRADAERTRKPKRPDWRVEPDHTSPVTVRKAP